jgi:hypothetical protein
MNASPFGFECFVISRRRECTTARRYVKRREADCGLRIADCGFIDSENPAFIVSTLPETSHNYQSAIRNQKNLYP